MTGQAASLIPNIAVSARASIPAAWRDKGASRNTRANDPTWMQPSDQPARSAHHADDRMTEPPRPDHS